MSVACPAIFLQQLRIPFQVLLQQSYLQHQKGENNIALKYETNKSRIERSIRHAIETGWNRGNYKFIEEIFGHSIDLNKSKPTNLEFIFTLADKIRLEEQKYLKKFCNQIDFN